MIVAVTGGTGFTGEFVIEALRRAGHQMRCLIRPGSAEARRPECAALVEGRLEDPASLATLLSGADALVKVSSLGFGHARNAIEACRIAGVTRAVFFSTTSIFTRLPTQSGAVRREAEDLIRASALDWTILRPTMIYGTERDRNFSRLIRWLSWAPVVPLPGGGRALVQPVYVEDLAGAVVSVLETPSTISRAYNLPGAEPAPLADLVRFLLQELGRRAPLVNVPLRPAAALAALWRRTGLPPRISREQVLRLSEDKAFEFDDARRDFGYKPMSWRNGLNLELERLRSRSAI